MNTGIEPISTPRLSTSANSLTVPSRVNNVTTLSWQRLLCSQRLSRHFRPSNKSKIPCPPSLPLTQTRNDIERDHDRILFSTPFRRLGDKTQVFPLESIESIRTRLTHSYEVANLARSIGIQLATTYANELPSDAIRTIPAALAAVGLVHDLGNPPFGHQGEQSIRSWFKQNKKRLLKQNKRNSKEVNADVSCLTRQQTKDFLEFEGNAQTLRLVAKLQVVGDDLGLNLTVCTLASLMKYVVASDKRNSSNQACKKNGFFSSEQKIVEIIRDYVGLTDTARHPLALVMEACDDVAYSVIDAEDAVKKDLVSFNDLMTWLRSNGESHDATDPVIEYVCGYSECEHSRLRKQRLHPAELNDVSMQHFRTKAIHILVCAVLKSFSENYKQIMDGTFSASLVDLSAGSNLCKALKHFDRENAYKHRSVLEIELNGHNVIHRLMDFLWQGISHRAQFSCVESRRTNPFAEYVYNRISRNYRRVFEGKINFSYEHDTHPVRYRELQLLTDMVSGMTDQFCIDLYNDLLRHHTMMKPVDGTFS